MKRSNCDDCGNDHAEEYVEAEKKLSKRHKQFTALFLFSVGMAVTGAAAVKVGFGVWTLAVFGIYFAYVNLAACDQGRTLIARTLADMAKAGHGKKGDDSAAGGGQYL